MQAKHVFVQPEVFNTLRLLLHLRQLTHVAWRPLPLYKITQALQYRLIKQCRFGLQQRHELTAAVQYCGRRLAVVCQMPSLAVLLRQRIDEREVLRERRNGVQPRDSSRGCRMWDRRVDLSFCGRMWRGFANQQHAQQRSRPRKLAFVLAPLTKSALAPQPRWPSGTVGLQQERNVHVTSANAVSIAEGLVPYRQCGCPCRSCALRRMVWQAGA